MKKLFYAAAAVGAAMALAPAANAAVTVNCPGTVGTATCNFSEATGTGFYGDSFSTATPFDDYFNIVLALDHAASVTLTNTIAVGGPISFSSHELLDSSLVSLGNINGGGVANTFILDAGTYSLHFAGSTSGTASYSGTIDIAPVPEPATWALMIAGIAAVGIAMRRRARNVRVAFS